MNATPEARNMRLIGQSDLNGFGNGGEGMALQRTRDGRRVLYIAHESAPKNFTAVDVTDPRSPRVGAAAPARALELARCRWRSAGRRIPDG